MIEPTDETVMALWCLLPSEVQDGRELDDIRPWVAAVLDAAARDYCLKPRGHENVSGPPTCTATVDTKGTVVRCTKKPDGHDTHLGRLAGWDVIW